VHLFIGEDLPFTSSSASLLRGSGVDASATASASSMFSCCFLSRSRCYYRSIRCFSCGSRIYCLWLIRFLIRFNADISVDMK